MSADEPDHEPDHEPPPLLSRDERSAALERGDLVLVLFNDIRLDQMRASVGAYDGMPASSTRVIGYDAAIGSLVEGINNPVSLLSRRADPSPSSWIDDHQAGEWPG